MQRRGDARVHFAGQNVFNNLHILFFGNADAVDEFDAAIRRFESLRNFLASAVDNDKFCLMDIFYRFCQMGKLGVSLECSAANFYQNSSFHASNPMVSGNPSIKFMFCTAWVLAPFPRLSMAEKITTTLVFATVSNPRKQ